MTKINVKPKIKPLMPSQREKKRYVSFEIIAKDEIKFNNANNAISNSFKELYGEIGLANAGIILIKNKYSHNKGILRVNNKYLNQIRFSIAMIKQIEKYDCIVKSLTASGMIKKATEKISNLTN